MAPAAAIVPTAAGLGPEASTLREQGQRFVPHGRALEAWIIEGQLSGEVAVVGRDPGVGDWSLRG